MTNQNTNTAASSKAARKFPTPSKMKEYLDQYVIGQDEAKKTLCVAVYNHFKRIAMREAGMLSDEDIAKSNVILVGETGSGKTLLVKTIARMLGIPYHIQDCTKITASGYVGSDVEDCIVGLLRNADYNVARAQKGIVLLDEIDKNAVKSSGPSITRDVSGECVQQSLLKIVEGDVVGCPPNGGRKHPEQPLIQVDTKDVLFIASGAFVGLEDIVSRRLGAGKDRIGFDSPAVPDAPQTAGKTKCVLSHTSPKDLRDFGMIPEFVGRFPVITNVEPLSAEDLVHILTEPKDALVKQYQRLLDLDDVKLDFTPEALKLMADTSVQMKTGARGLRNIMEMVMRDVMFEAPSMRKPRGAQKTFTVDEAFIRAKLEGRISLETSVA